LSTRDHNPDKEISRVRRTKLQSRNSYNRISRWYDLLEGRWEEDAVNQGLNMLGIREGHKVLEIGPGPGKALLTLARLVGETGRVYGLDISDRMLTLARKRLYEASIMKRAEFVLGDGARLPFREKSFDLLFMSFVLELFDTPEISRVLLECQRVLRNNGRIGVVSLSKAGGSKPVTDLYEWGHKKFPSILDCRPVYVHESLQDAGFEVLDSRYISLWGLSVEIAVGKNA
jgi:ubiquinone/menaquinone biosynthesis C-methylase UbiE